MATTNTAKKTSHLKGRILAKLSNIERNGRSKSGLLSIALDKIEQMIKSGDFDTYDKGIDKLLKLLPYALPKIGYDKPLIDKNDLKALGSNTYSQVNIYLSNRNQSLEQLKSVDTTNTSSITDNQDTTGNTENPVASDADQKTESSIPNDVTTDNS